MADELQKRDNILTKIDVIISKLDIDDTTSMLDRNQIRLILTNLKSSLSNCDEK